METFLDTFSGSGRGGTNSFGRSDAGSGELNSDSMFQSSPWGSLSEVGLTSLEQVFRGNTGGNLARSDDNTSGSGFGGGGNASSDDSAGSSSEIATAISEPVSSAIENQSPLTSEASQELAEDVGFIIEGSIDITGSDAADSSTNDDALLSGGAITSSNTLGFSIRTALDSYFISDEFSSNFTEVPNNTGTDSVLPISGSSTGGSSFGSGNPPSDDLFSQSPWGRLEVVGIESFSGIFDGGAASGSN